MVWMLLFKHHLVITEEHMEAGDVHDQLTQLHLVPHVGVNHAARLQNMDCKSYGHVDIIIKMAIEVATPNMVSNIEATITENKMIAQSTRLTAFIGI